jgi:hypothetical protein
MKSRHNKAIIPCGFIGSGRTGVGALRKVWNRRHIEFRTTTTPKSPQTKAVVYLQRASGSGLSGLERLAVCSNLVRWEMGGFVRTGSTLQLHYQHCEKQRSDLQPQAFALEVPSFRVADGALLLALLSEYALAEQESAV